jgi:hypothetical protein
MVIGRGGNWAKWLGGELVMGEMGKKLGEMGNGRNGIGRNGNTPSLHISSIVWQWRNTSCIVTDGKTTIK